MGYRIKELHISGYKRLADVSVKTGGLNVLIGPNGCGKTSFLDVLELLSHSAGGRLKTLMDSGGFDSVLTRNDTTKGLCIAVDYREIDTKRPPLNYELELVRLRDSYRISKEVLTQHFQNFEFPQQHLYREGESLLYYSATDKKKIPFEGPVERLETGLAQVSGMYQQVSDFRKMMSECYYYRSSDLRTDINSAIRIPDSMKQEELPKADGSGLASALYQMREEHEEAFDEVMNALQIVFPDLDKIALPTAGPGRLWLRWKDMHYKEGFYNYELSEGTLRFLLLATILCTPTLPPVLLFDEPEVNLHPQMMRVLVGLMRIASARTQIFVATHSEHFVRALKPEEVLAFSMDEGVTDIQNLDAEALKEWLTDYTLDQLWNMNIIGGR